MAPAAAVEVMSSSRRESFRFRMTWTQIQSAVYRLIRSPRRRPRAGRADLSTGRLLCACDAGVLFAIDAASGRVRSEVPLSGVPDVIFLHPQSGRLYVAIGDPGVIDVVDISTMRCEEVVPT